MIELAATGILNFLGIAIAAVLVQNIVLSRAIGVSSLLSLVDDTTSTAQFGLLLTSVTTLGGVFNWFVNYYGLSAFGSNAYYLRPLCLIACMSLAYLIVFVFVVKFTPSARLQKAADALPLATFNCTAIGTLLLSVSMQLELFDTICYSIGTGVGFVLAVLLVTEGQRKIQSDKTPVAFRGLPVTLLYIAGLALAIYGLLGYSFTA